MKKIISLLSILFTLIAGAQPKLSNASVELDIKSSDHIEVKQTLLLDIADSVKQIHLKLLKFKGTEITLNEINTGKATLNFREDHSNELLLLTLFTHTNFKHLELKYTVQPENELFYLPLFFTEFPSASSDNDFFKAKLAIDEDQQMVMHFPKVDMITEEILGKRLINMQIPALPSLFRMELSSEAASGASLTSIVDWMVALVFVLIGIIIWKKRNQLRYG